MAGLGFFLLLFLFGIAYWLLLAGHGLWSGEILEVGKYGKRRISMAAEPGLFWFSFVYHAALGAVFAFLGANGFGRMKGWIKNKPWTEADQRALDRRIAELAKPRPLVRSSIKWTFIALLGLIGAAFASHWIRVALS